MRCCPGVAVFILALVSTNAAEWTVGNKSGEPTLATALQNAAPGDIIHVLPGVYQGNLILDRTVTLIGEGRPVLRGAGTGSVVTVNAPGYKNLKVNARDGYLAPRDPH